MVWPYDRLPNEDPGSVQQQRERASNGAYVPASRKTTGARRVLQAHEGLPAGLANRLPVRSPRDGEPLFSAAVTAHIAATDLDTGLAETVSENTTHSQGPD